MGSVVSGFCLVFCYRFGDYVNLLLLRGLLFLVCFVFVLFAFSCLIDLDLLL